MGVIVGERMKCGGEWWGIFFEVQNNSNKQGF
jgi:hypothetical protein